MRRRIVSFEVENEKKTLSHPFFFLPTLPSHSRYEPLVRHSALATLATVYALDMPGQGASPRPRARGTGSPGALESYSFLALAAVAWLREEKLMSSSISSSSSAPLLCAFGHSGGGLAALRAEQERPGTFAAVRRRILVFHVFFGVFACCLPFFTFLSFSSLCHPWLMPSPSTPLFYTQLYLYEPVVLAAESIERNQRENPASASPSLTSSPPPALSSTPSLEAGARRRRRSFASREAALDSLARKPPFSLFDSECARIYVEEGMISGDDDDCEGEVRERNEKGGSVLSSSSLSAATAPSSNLSSSTAVSLAASPEDEAAVYLEAGPLGTEAGRRLELVAAPVVVAAGGGAGGVSGEEAQKQNPNLHAPLARAAERTARLLPRGALEVHGGLSHLGPFEDPGFVGDRAAAAFATARAAAAVDKSWQTRSLPSSSLSAKL